MRPHQNSPLKCTHDDFAQPHRPNETQTKKMTERNSKTITVLCIDSRAYRLTTLEIIIIYTHETVTASNRNIIYVIVCRSAYLRISMCVRTVKAKKKKTNIYLGNSIECGCVCVRCITLIECSHSLLFFFFISLL